MNELETQEKGAPPALNVPRPAGQPLSFSGRRRFIKLGTSAVPVAMTLASQPVMAWHCDSTSAWGSAQMAGNVGSAKTRLDTYGQDGTECWSISNWKNNTIYSPAGAYKPWKTLAMARYLSPNNTSSYARANCKVADIFPAGLLGVSSTATVDSVVMGSNTFARAVTVAQLNTLYASSKGKINMCVVAGGKNQIQEMARLGANYAAPNSITKKWSTAEIEAYLSSNWLAVA